MPERESCSRWPVGVAILVALPVLYVTSFGLSWRLVSYDESWLPVVRNVYDPCFRLLRCEIPQLEPFKDALHEIVWFSGGDWGYPTFRAVTSWESAAYAGKAATPIFD